MRCVDGVGTVNASGRYHSYRRLLLFHSSDLYRRRLRAKQYLVGDVESVLRVARRVVFGYVQRLEVIVIEFDLGTFLDRKSHTDKYVLEFSLNERERMRMSERRVDGERYVDFFFFQFCFEQTAFEFLFALFNGVFDVNSYVVGKLSDLRTLFG